MNMRTLLILLSSLFALHATAQTFSLHGRVLDENGAPLELATVACIKQGKVTMTNLKGEYSMTLQAADSVEIRFSMVGYQTRTRLLQKPRTNQTLQVQLQPMEDLKEVTVTERRRQTTPTEQLNIKDLKGTPTTTGNAVEELIQQQAGVSSHSELSSQYNVRGGSFDENSVYINNVEVYRPLLIRSGQQEGLSVINPDMVEKIGFSTGGYEAKYGDKMSSALDITYHRAERTQASATASLLGAQAFVAVANKQKTFSMSHGLRYKTTKALLKSLETSGEYDPRFLDYQTYISYRPNSRWSLDIIGNISDNKYNFKPKDRETSFGTMESVKTFKVYFDGQEQDLFRTYFGTASLSHHFGDSTSLKLFYSAFHTREQECYDLQGQYWLDDTQTTENLGVGTYMEHGRNYLKARVHSLQLMFNKRLRQHDVEAGVTYKWEHVSEQSREYEMRDSAGYSVPHSSDRLDLIYTLSSVNEIDSRRVEGYVQDRWRFASGQNYFTLAYGVRFSHWSFNGETLLSPRASLSWVPAFNDRWTFRLASGLYYQAPFYKELRDTTTNTAGVTVATLNEHIRSPRSIHAIIGADYRFRVAERPFRFTAEAYYKALSRIIPYNVQNVKVTYYGENLCSGYTAGIDMKLYGEFVPGTDSWLTFSLMTSRQKLDGQWIPMPTDQRWGLNLHFTDYFPGTKRWLMTLRTALAGGLPFGPPHRGLGSDTFRAPAYRRVDIGLSYHLLDNQNRQHGRLLRNIWIGADCLNLLGISNVNSYYWVTDVTNRQYAVPNYLTGRQFNFNLRIEL